MCISPSDSSSLLEHAKPGLPKYQMDTHHRQKPISISSKDGPEVDILNVRFSFNEKLMRTEEERRDFIYVYDYSQNRTRRMRTQDLLEKLGATGDRQIDQAPIPYSMRSIPIKTSTGGFGGGTVVARVHVNIGLRVQRWLGVQKRLYIVDAIKR
ncbi:hypothetical protein E4T48_08382 [Aureobasidium sp. EXF-10727]|nr:hypothetical protein E4T48_08382 [Aureobasidium sp. EXF-10727]